MRRIFILLAAGAVITALTATAAFAQQTGAGTINFEVNTEGKVPEDTTFTGFYRVPGTPSSAGEVQLTDPDGDGTYTGTASSAIGGEGVVPAGEYVVRIDQEPKRNVTTISGPETITVSDGETETVSVSIDFGGSDGGSQGEAIYGTYGDNTLDGKGGDDLIVGEAGADAIFGGSGDDFLVSGYAYFQQAPYAPASSDYVEGGPGNDLIDSADLAGAPDTVVCGPGGDLVYAGVEDYVSNDCEVVYRYFGF